MTSNLNAYKELLKKHKADYERISNEYMTKINRLREEYKNKIAFSKKRFDNELKRIQKRPHNLRTSFNMPAPRPTLFDLGESYNIPPSVSPPRQPIIVRNRNPPSPTTRARARARARARISREIKRAQATTTPNKIYTNAELAMYRAKKRHRSSVRQPMSK